jgi:hypothetical protein
MRPGKNSTIAGKMKRRTIWRTVAIIKGIMPGTRSTEALYRPRYDKQVYPDRWSDNG